MRRLAEIVPVSILIIFLLLFDAYKSFPGALVIIANIPFSVIGGILALFGQAVLNGVVMVTLFNQLRADGVPLERAVRGIGSETRKPLAVVVIGGLVTATLLVLFVLPVLYSLISKKQP